MAGTYAVKSYMKTAMAEVAEGSQSKAKSLACQGPSSPISSRFRHSRQAWRSLVSHALSWQLADKVLSFYSYLTIWLSQYCFLEQGFSLKKEHPIIIENNIIRVVAVIKLTSGLGLMALKSRHVKRVRISTNVLSASEKWAHKKCIYVIGIKKRKTPKISVTVPFWLIISTDWGEIVWTVSPISKLFASLHKRQTNCSCIQSLSLS